MTGFTDGYHRVQTARVVDGVWSDGAEVGESGSGYGG